MQLGNLLGALVRAPRSAPGRLALARDNADARLELLHNGYDAHVTNSGSRWLRCNLERPEWLGESCFA